MKTLPTPGGEAEGKGIVETETEAVGLEWSKGSKRSTLPDLLRLGSRWLHMMRMGFPLSTSKFIVSRALSAAKDIRHWVIILVTIKCGSSCRLTVGRLLKVDVGVAEGPASDHVSADAETPNEIDQSQEVEVLPS